MFPKIVLHMAILALLSTCAAPMEPRTATLPPTETPIPTSTSAPTPEAPARPEAEYRKTLTEEQQALFDQSKDMTAEGYGRKFLEGDLSSYLAYFDKAGEVAYVYNFEQGKLNPALKIENNLLVNEVSSSFIVWNPELNIEESKQTLADYFRYARARVCAAGAGVQLPKTLDVALADPKAQEFLEHESAVIFTTLQLLILQMAFG